MATIIHHDTKIDTPLSITTLYGTFYYHRDHQGSIVALSDEYGDIVENIEYDEHYGRIIKHTKRSDVKTLNPYGYTGREIETNDLYYYRARYYDASTQRFLSVDPIGFMSGDFNFYRYVGNSPVSFVDPFGLEETHLTQVLFNDNFSEFGADNHATMPTKVVLVSGTPSENFGTCNYYLALEIDHKNRYGENNASCPIPDYYRDYGYKYCDRFKNETMENLSPEGQDWLDRTLRRLQENMKSGLKNGYYNNVLEDENIIVEECNPDAFKDFAFATHPDAYSPSEMSGLSIPDLYNIGTTPDMAEWGSTSTWSQAWTVAKNMDYEELGEGIVEDIGGYVDDLIDSDEEN